MHVLGGGTCCGLGAAEVDASVVTRGGVCTGYRGFLYPRRVFPDLGMAYLVGAGVIWG